MVMVKMVNVEYGNDHGRMGPNKQKQTKPKSESVLLYLFLLA